MTSMTAEDERAAVVAWLRRMNSRHAEMLADRIERGDHITPGGA